MTQEASFYLFLNFGTRQSMDFVREKENRALVENSQGLRHHQGFGSCIAAVQCCQARPGLSSEMAQHWLGPNAFLCLHLPYTRHSIFDSHPPQRSPVIFSSVLGLKALLKTTKPQPSTIRQAIQSIFERNVHQSWGTQQKASLGEGVEGGGEWKGARCDD